MEGRVVSVMHLGLSNRIKSMVSAFVYTTFADRYIGLDVKVFWPVNNAVGASFDELFDVPGMEVSEYPQKPDIEFRTWRLMSKQGPVDFGYHRISNLIREELTCLFAKFRPSDEVSDRRDKLLEKLPKNSCAMLIRTWPNCNYRSAMVTDYTAMLVDVPDDYTIFISGDSRSAVDDARQLCGDRDTIVHEVSCCNRDTAEGMKNAFAEQLVAAELPIIIGGHNSTFPEIAWWLGGAKATVLIQPRSQLNM